jgi:hypothetical protein
MALLIFHGFSLAATKAKTGLYSLGEKKNSWNYPVFGADKTHNVLLGTHTKYTHGDLCD